MTHATERSPLSEEGGTYLRVALRVEPQSDVSCAVTAAGDRGESVTQREVCPDGSCDGPCVCRSEVRTGGHTELVSGEIQSGCICPVFRDHDCVASIDGFDGRELVVSVALPDRDELSRLVSSLRDVGARVRLQRITTAGSPETDTTLELDADRITDKEREAVNVAIEMGYYERPRKTDLSELADRLGVSRSAVSQRLNNVETKLVDELFRAQNGTREWNDARAAAD